MARAMLIDISKCSACRGCVVACKQWNRLPAEDTRFTGTYENPPDFTAQTWSRIRFTEVEQGDNVQWLFTKVQCMHCTDAACVMVCPAGATHKTPAGLVAVDKDKCIGCNYCVAACPFNIPKYNQRINAMQKCTFCADRVTAGKQPACALTCPTGAITFDDSSVIATKAHERVEQLKAQGYRNAQVYGETEMGGMRMMYVLTDDPSVVDLPRDPSVPTSAHVWSFLYRPLRAVVVAAAAIGLIGNRMRSKDLEPKEKEE